MYSPQVLDHFHNPRNVGEISNPAAVVEISNPACGDVLKLSVSERNGSIVEAKFQVQGCVPAVACASWLTEAIKGKPLAELAQLSAEQMEAALGGLPAASSHASALAIAALRKALDKLRP